MATEASLVATEAPVVAAEAPLMATEASLVATEAPESDALGALRVRQERSSGEYDAAVDRRIGLKSLRKRL
ncbi:hypothetical protein GCM10027425_24520 [Alteromonas gracilis]